MAKGGLVFAKMVEESWDGSFAAFRRWIDQQKLMVMLDEGANARVDHF